MLRYSTDLTNESLVRKGRLVRLLLASGHLDKPSNNLTNQKPANPEPILPLETELIQCMEQLDTQHDPVSGIYAVFLWHSIYLVTADVEACT